MNDIFKQQILTENKRNGEIKLITNINDDYMEALNRKEKAEIGKGMSKKGNFQKVASITFDILNTNSLLAAGLHGSDAALTEYLYKNPQYRCSTGRI